MSSLVPQTLTHEFDYDSARDLSNPRSLVNILPSVAAERVLAIPQSIYESDVNYLKRKFKDDKNIDLLRIAWWVEYNRCQKTLTAFHLPNVYGGLMGGSLFKREYLNNSFKLFYIMTPPVDYQVQQHHILNIAFEQEMKILSLPALKTVYNKNGDPVGEEVDSKLLAIQQKIADSMRNRVMGMPINRSMQINQNFNNNVPSYNSPTLGDGGSKALEAMDETELQQYIESIKEEKGLSDKPSVPLLKDVEQKKS